MAIKNKIAILDFEPQTPEGRVRFNRRLTFYLPALKVNASKKWRLKWKSTEYVCKLAADFLSAKISRNVKMCRLLLAGGAKPD
jgi:hypothetical protein